VLANDSTYSPYTGQTIAALVQGPDHGTLEFHPDGRFV